VFQVLKKKNNCQARLLYPAKVSFIIEGETKICHDKQKLKQFMTTKPVLQRYLKEPSTQKRNIITTTKIQINLPGEKYR
jgi:hypothetical protein